MTNKDVPPRDDERTLAMLQVLIDAKDETIRKLKELLRDLTCQRDSYKHDCEALRVRVRALEKPRRNLR